MNTQQFVENWLQSWNNHDLAQILSHFSEDVEITTPMIKIATGRPESTLYGKSALKDYWEIGLEKFPDLNFEIISVAEGVNSIAIYYKTVLDKTAIEVLHFNENGVVNKLHAYYVVQNQFWLS